MDEWVKFARVTGSCASSYSHSWLGCLGETCAGDETLDEELLLLKEGVSTVLFFLSF